MLSYSQEPDVELSLDEESLLALFLPRALSDDLRAPAARGPDSDEVGFGIDVGVTGPDSVTVVTTGATSTSFLTFFVSAGCINGIKE